MSSIAEKSLNHTAAGKRGFFLRSSSIQKIKCSATYPFRIAGSKLSREAIKQLLESVIIKARLLSQKTLLVFYVATFRMLGTILSLWPNLLSIDDVSHKLKVTDEELTFTERLLNRLVKLRIHKLQHQKYKEASIEKKENVQPTSLVEKESTKTTTSVNPRLAIDIATWKLLLTAKPEPRKPNVLFVLFVYASAIFIYLELLFLTLALNTTTLPPGLVFMIFSLLLIGYLASKVFLKESRQRRSLKRASRIKSQTTSLSRIEGKTAQSSVTENNNNRQNRLRFRKTVDLSSKTLSKIKLL